MCDDFRYPYCSTCGDNFPIRKKAYEALEECGNTFYCPLGHGLVITRESIVSQLRTEKRRSRYQQDSLEKLRKRMASYLGVQTRHRNRLLRGECPYCGENVFVSDLIGHIKAKHGPKKTS